MVKNRSSMLVRDYSKPAGVVEVEILALIEGLLQAKALCLFNLNVKGNHCC